jgi:hypothetical protein
MLLPLGILASASGGADYELISTTLVTSAVASVTFSSLNTAAAAYKHLQLRYTGRTTRGVSEDGSPIMYLNGDTAANYRSHYLVGNSSTTSSYDNGTSLGLGSHPGSSAGSYQFLGSVIDILDFSQTTKNTTLRIAAGLPGSFNSVRLASGAWFNTAAVTSVQVSANVGNWEVGSRFSLYGLKG